MNQLEKLDTKRGVAISIGTRFEELLEGAEKRTAEALGAHRAVFEHVKNLLGIMAAVDAEIDKTLDLEQAALVKSWVAKCVAATENLAGHLRNVALQTAGETAGYRAAHDFLQEVVKDIDKGLAALDKAISDGTVIIDKDGDLEAAPTSTRRPPGVRPALSIAQQRKRSEKGIRRRPAAVKSAEANTEASTVSPDTSDANNSG